MLIMVTIVKLLLELIKAVVAAVEETMALLAISFIILCFILWKLFKKK